MEAIQDRSVTIVARSAVRELIDRDLRNAGIRDVVVGPMGSRDQMLAFFTDLLGLPPLEVDGVELWRNVDRRGVAPPPP